MWTRKGCAICRTNFAIHPKAKSFQTRQLCIRCRKVGTFLANVFQHPDGTWNNKINQILIDMRRQKAC